MAHDQGMYILFEQVGRLMDQVYFLYVNMCCYFFKGHIFFLAGVKRPFQQCQVEVVQRPE
jgi:hypothetical protein